MPRRGPDVPLALERVYMGRKLYLWREQDKSHVDFNAHKLLFLSRVHDCADSAPPPDSCTGATVAFS